MGETPRTLVATEGIHYTSSMPDGYPAGWAMCAPHATADGSDAFVYVEVGLREGYTMGRLTPEDAAELGRRLIVAADTARQDQTAKRHAWYGRAWADAQ